MWLFGALVMVLLGVMVSGPLKQRLAQLRRGDWRPGAGVLAIAAIIGGLFMMVREAFLPGAVLLAVGISGLIAARKRAQAQSDLKAPVSMDRAEAASILGVAETASAAEVQAAYLRLMRLAHPDAGGSTGLASQLNRARAVMRGASKGM